MVRLWDRAMAMDSSRVRLLTPIRYRQIFAPFQESFVDRPQFFHLSRLSSFHSSFPFSQTKPNIQQPPLTLTLISTSTSTNYIQRWLLKFTERPFLPNLRNGTPPSRSSTPINTNSIHSRHNSQSFLSSPFPPSPFPSPFHHVLHFPRSNQGQGRAEAVRR